MPHYRLLRILRLLLIAPLHLYILGLTIYLILRLQFGDTVGWLAFLNNLGMLAFVPMLIVLPVVILLRAKYVAPLAIFLSLVGLTWVGPTFLPKPQPNPSGPRLNIVTFNAMDSNQRQVDIAPWLRQQNPDIVLMQENPHDFIFDSAPKFMDMYPYQVIQSQAGKNLIFSRYPILSSEILQYSEHDSQRVTIDFNGRIIAIYNVHFSNPFGEERPTRPGLLYFVESMLRYDDTTRNAEISRLLAQVSREPYPFIVAGDFNMSSQSATYQHVAASMQDTFQEVGAGLGASWPISTEAGVLPIIPPILRIDYIWHSAHFRGLKIEVGTDNLGSDHLPLYGTLELRAGNAQ